MLVDWRAAVIDAKPDADRFLRAALERQKKWLSDYETAPENLAAVVRAIQNSLATTDVGHLCRQIASAAMPIGVLGPETGGMRIPKGDVSTEAKPAPVELAVAFLRFAIDGVPAAETHFLTPREAHDLEIEVRVSRWPEKAESLDLTPMSIEAASTYSFPSFSFNKPQGDPPFVVKQNGRAVLNVAQSLNARPFEFKYAAHFRPLVTESLSVVGQRTLRIEGFDLAKAPITGYRGLDERLIKIRDELRTQPAMNQEDLGSILIVLNVLASLSARALQDSLFKGGWSEAQFQAEVRNELRRNPHIGSELEEHPHAAGGSVLDSSPKDTPPYPAEEGIEVLMRRPKNQTVCIVAVVIQGNLAMPSSLSR